MSVKVKLLLIIITLSLAGLVVSGFYSYQTYKEDKLAYIYETMSDKTEFHSRLFSAIIEDHEMLLNSLIAVSDLADDNSLAPVRAYLESDQRKILGIFALIADTENKEVTVFRGKSLDPVILSWEKLKSAPSGFSLIDKTQGQFLIKKSLGTQGFLAIAFEHSALWGVLKPEEGKTAFFLRAKEVIAQEKLPFPAKDLLSLHPKMAKLPGSEGLFESSLAGVPHIVTYSRLGDKDLYLVNVIPSGKLLLVKDIIFRQIISFLVLIGSLALLIGTLAARWLTLRLDELTEAVREMENENLDVEVSIKSRDEIGALGRAFNLMAGRIKNLLEDLRLHNLELEEKVRERTIELQNLTDIQKGMLNALGQGFVIVDRDHNILPVYSKVSESMFEVDPPQSDPGHILGVSDAESESFRELFTMAFEGQLALEDVTKLAPANRTNSRDRMIELNYAPVHQGETENFDYVLIIGTDKTDEFESREKARREWEYSQMVQKIASNRFAVNRVLAESLDMMAEAEISILQEHPESVIKTQRLVHTVKGGVSYFHMKEISEACHRLESFLSPYIAGDPCPGEIRSEALKQILFVVDLIEDYIVRFDEIIMHSHAQKQRSIQIEDLVRFQAVIESELPMIAQEFQESFFWDKLGPFFEIYPGLVKELGEKLGKEIRFVMEGETLAIPPGKWQEVFGQFIHFMRNSADHGIETPEERSARGKDPIGSICFKFDIIDQNGQRWLRALLYDDGKGVDWEKMAKKDPTITSLSEALDRIKNGGVSSKDEVSEFSGRGVGISALNQSVLKWGGRLELDSIDGAGFQVTIDLPLGRAEIMNLKRVA